MRDSPISDATLLKIAIDVPLSREFDYLTPAESATPMPGCRVLAPVEPLPLRLAVHGKGGCEATLLAAERFDEQPKCQSHEPQLMPISASFVLMGPACLLPTVWPP